MPEPEEFIGKLVAGGGAVPLFSDPHQLLQQDEHEQLERKSTLRWDLKTLTVNRSLERSALKTVAAFLNSRGGHLVLGVADDGAVVGMEHDYATLVRKDADGLVNHFGNLFNAMLGAHLRHLVRVQPFYVKDKACMVVSVAPSDRPVYLADEGKEEFFVRTGNGTTSLKLSEAAAYVESRYRTKQ
jgi:predicted HTH transcriptional regulator